MPSGCEVAGPTQADTTSGSCSGSGGIAKVGGAWCGTWERQSVGGFRRRMGGDRLSPQKITSRTRAHKRRRIEVTVELTMSSNGSYQHEYDINLEDLQVDNSQQEIEHLRRTDKVERFHLASMQTMVALSSCFGTRPEPFRVQYSGPVSVGTGQKSRISLPRPLSEESFDCLRTLADPHSSRHAAFKRRSGAQENIARRWLWEHHEHGAEQMRVCPPRDVTMPQGLLPLAIWLGT